MAVFEKDMVRLRQHSYWGKEVTTKVHDFEEAYPATETDKKDPYNRPLDEDVKEDEEHMYAMFALSNKISRGYSSHFKLERLSLKTC